MKRAIIGAYRNVKEIAYISQNHAKSLSILLTHGAHHFKYGSGIHKASSRSDILFWVALRSSMWVCLCPEHGKWGSVFLQILEGRFWPVTVGVSYGIASAWVWDYLAPSLFVPMVLYLSGT